MHAAKLFLDSEPEVNKPATALRLCPCWYKKELLNCCTRRKTEMFFSSSPSVNNLQQFFFVPSRVASDYLIIKHLQFSMYKSVFLFFHMPFYTIHYKLIFRRLRNIASHINTFFTILLAGYDIIRLLKIPTTTQVRSYSDNYDII